MGLDSAVARHVRGSYPRNNDYRVVGRRLVPSWKLWRRRRRLVRHYPERVESLLDVSCSTGYFTLDAARRPSCERALGIDVSAEDLAAARAVGAHLQSAADFVETRLDAVAAELDEHGGAFQVVLLLNAYPYLLLGSPRDERRYDSHDRVFELLARVCGERLLFSNRVELERLPRHMQRRAAELGLGPEDYTESILAAAAEPWFELSERDSLGRIPLWVLTRRAP